MTDEDPTDPGIDPDVALYGEGKIASLTADNDELGALVFGVQWADFKAMLAAVKDVTTVSVRVAKTL